MPSTKTVFVTELCKPGYSRHSVKQFIIFAVYSRVTSLRTHLLRAIRPLANEFHLAHFVSSICPVVITMSLAMSADSNPSQFSFLTRELLILLHFHLLATKGTHIATRVTRYFSPSSSLYLSLFLSVYYHFVSTFRQAYLMVLPLSALSFPLFLSRIYVANTTWCKRQKATINCNGASVNSYIIHQRCVLFRHKKFWIEITNVEILLQLLFSIIRKNNFN